MSFTESAWDDYKSKLNKSSDAIWVVGRYLYEKGYAVTIPPLRVAKDLSQYRQFIDDGDLILHRDGDEIVEVKHQSFDWVCRTDIPYESVIVCAKKSYDRHKVKPSVYFLVNKQMSHAIVVPTSTKEKWFTAIVHDKKKDWNQEMYKIHTSNINFIELQNGNNTR